MPSRNLADNRWPTSASPNASPSAAGCRASSSRLCGSAMKRAMPKIPQALQLRLRHAAGPDQDQVGLQFQQAFEIDLAVAADGRQVANRRRTLAAIQHADQAARCAEFEDAVGQRRRQADHPLRRPGGKAEEQAGEQPERAHQPS